MASHRISQCVSLALMSYVFCGYSVCCFSMTLISKCGQIAIAHVAKNLTTSVSTFRRRPQAVRDFNFLTQHQQGGPFALMLAALENMIKIFRLPDFSKLSCLKSPFFFETLSSQHQFELS